MAASMQFALCMPTKQSNAQLLVNLKLTALGRELKIKK